MGGVLGLVVEHPGEASHGRGAAIQGSACAKTPSSWEGAPQVLRAEGIRVGQSPGEVFLAGRRCLEAKPRKTPESPLDCKEGQPVHPKGNQP